jgi:hypothetical protein
MGKLAHLASRYREMGTPVTTEASDTDFARVHLSESLLTLWSTMDVRDRRHAVVVARRFMTMVPNARPAEMAAALLHDVGKAQCSLGRGGRVAATLFGGLTREMRVYRRHEEIGAQAIARAGGDQRTVDMVAGRSNDAAAQALREADDAY